MASCFVWVSNELNTGRSVASYCERQLLCLATVPSVPIPAIQLSPEPPVSENQVLRTWTPRSGHWRAHTTGHNQPVGVTFQFQQVGHPVIEVDVRYSASNLTPSLLRPDHDRPVKKSLHCRQSHSIRTTTSKLDIPCGSRHDVAMNTIFYSVVRH